MAHAALQTQHADETGSLVAEEASVEAERLALAEDLAELSKAKEELFALDNKAQLSAQRAEHYQDESAMLVVRAEHARKESDGLAQRAEQNTETLAATEGQVAMLDAEADARIHALEAMEQTCAEAKSELATARRQLDHAVAGAGAARTRIARLESDVESARVRAEDLAHRLEELLRDEATSGEVLLRMSGEAAEVGERASELQARAETLVEKKSQYEDQVSTLRGEVARGEIELETLREEAHRRRSRLQSLAEIQERYESFQRGVRAIMQKVREFSALPASERGGDGEGESKTWTTQGVRGLVADIVQPPPELETALEAVLGERLGNIIVESHEVGVEAIDFLKAQSEGRSSFIPLSLRASSPSGAVVYDATGGEAIEAASMVPVSVAWPSGEGVRGPMLELIGFDRHYDRIASYLLGDVIVVEDLHKALELWRQTKTQKTLVTLDGEVIDPHGVVTGGSRESATAGVLSQKREMRELEEVVARLDQDYKATLDRHVGNKQALAETVTAFDETVAAMRSDELELAAQRKDADRLAREQIQVEARRVQLTNTIASLRNSTSQNQARIEEATTQLATEQDVALEHEVRGEGLRSQVDILAEKVDTLLAELSTVNVAAAQAGDRKRMARESVERLRREIADSQTKRAQLDEDASRDLSRADSLRSQAEELRQEASLLQSELAERSRGYGERQGASEERSGVLARRDADLKAVRSHVARLAQEARLSRLALPAGCDAYRRS